MGGFWALGSTVDIVGVSRGRSGAVAVDVSDGWQVKCDMCQTDGISPKKSQQVKKKVPKKCQKAQEKPQRAKTSQNKLCKKVPKNGKNCLMSKGGIL